MARGVGTFVVVAILSCLAYRSTATDYTVGDKEGWASGADYSSWVTGKSFAVGDSLVFNYASGTHTVTEVTESNYKSCSSANYISSETTGPTTVALKTAGTHYYICTVPGHCEGGMKLAVPVQATSSSGSSSGSGSGTTTPSTTPSTSGSTNVPSPSSSVTVSPVAAVLATFTACAAVLISAVF